MFAVCSPLGIVVTVQHGYEHAMRMVILTQPSNGNATASAMLLIREARSAQSS
jgi:hypothetical protein